VILTALLRGKNARGVSPVIDRRPDLRCASVMGAYTETRMKKLIRSNSRFFFSDCFIPLNFAVFSTINRIY